jgi:hypothetical protein
VCSNSKLKRKKTQICLKWIKIVKKQQHIVNIFYMWMLCITLKERNTKRFVQNWLSSKSPSTEWSWFFIELVMFCLFACILQYSKSVRSKVGTRTVYMLIICILMHENCFRSGKSCKMYLAYSINIMLCYLFLKFCYSIKMMWNHTKPETLPPIIRRVRCLCENIILYRYQVALIILDYFFIFK